MTEDLSASSVSIITQFPYKQGGVARAWSESYANKARWTTIPVGVQALVDADFLLLEVISNPFSLIGFYS